MKRISILSFSLVAATLLSTSCKRTYQCTCPVVTMQAELYIFEVKASSLRTANKKCVDSGEEDPIVYKPDVAQCRVITR